MFIQRLSALRSRVPGCIRAMATTTGNPTSDQAPRRVVKGIVFDMDGTLTIPCIDFAEMRRRAGVTTGDILDVINSWKDQPDRQKKAWDAIAEVEKEALANMKIMPGTTELCSYIDSCGIPRAIVTRNVSSSLDFFHKTHFELPPFFPALSREWTPYKPDPAALVHIAEHWGVDSTELIMIGDSAKDDVVCGNRAGAATILLDVNGEYAAGMDDERLKGEVRPHYYVKSLAEITELLKKEFDLVVPPYPQASAAGGDS